MTDSIINREIQKMTVGLHTRKDAFDIQAGKGIIQRKRFEKEDNEFHFKCKI